MVFTLPASAVDHEKPGTEGVCVAVTVRADMGNTLENTNAHRELAGSVIALWVITDNDGTVKSPGPIDK